MNTNKQKTQYSGFTIVELMVVIAFIAIMAVSSLFLLRPGKNYTEENQNAERHTQVAHIAQAVKRYVQDTGTLPAGVTDESQTIGSQQKELPICKDLVPKYLKDLPVDPYAGGELTNGNCANGFLYTTGYTIEQSGEKSFVIAAPFAAHENIRLKITVN